MKIELTKGRVRWFYRVKAMNGQTLVTSQKYFSKSNAKRAALVAAERMSAKYKEV